MVRFFFLASLFVLTILSGCFATPLSRSYDDPYNAPLPNEPAPPSYSADEVACTRDPINSCSSESLRCKKDEDCGEGLICYRGECITPASLSNTSPP